MYESRSLRGKRMHVFQSDQDSVYRCNAHFGTTNMLARTFWISERMLASIRILEELTNDPDEMLNWVCCKGPMGNTDTRGFSKQALFVRSWYVSCLMISTRHIPATLLELNTLGVSRSIYVSRHIAMEDVDVQQAISPYIHFAICALSHSFERSYPWSIRRSSTHF